MELTRPALLGVLGVGVLLLGGCTTPDPVTPDPVNPDPGTVNSVTPTGATSAAATSPVVLRREQADALRLTRDVVQSARSALDGRAQELFSGFDGCVSAGPEEYASVRFSTSRRVDVHPTARRPYLTRVAARLREAGLVVRPGSVIGIASIEARSWSRGGGLTAVVTEPTGAAAAGGHFVLVRVTAPCVGISPGDTDEWLAP